MTKNAKKYSIENIGLFGLDSQFKLCHIPFITYKDVYGALALEGSSGTGKTTIVNRLGKLNEALTGGKVKTFSADKARYEDFNGCPIPNQDNREMVIYPMPNSVAQMDTVLIDEINRASYDSQEKWLALIATRQVDGLPTKCKFLFAAMNPVLSDGTDSYEGVQPLDKAMGERMMGLVQMPRFFKMAPEVRKSIIKNSSNQTLWMPTDEDVSAFDSFIKHAREAYENLKETAGDIVATYIDEVQSELANQTKGAVKIEARRAQYIYSNILAVHSLNSSFKGTSANLRESALEGLLMSFPNRLWEEEINSVALETAHKAFANILVVSNDTYKKSVANTGPIKKFEGEVRKVLQGSSKLSKELVTKTITQNIPAPEVDYLNYGILNLSIYTALSDTDLKTSKNSLMKEQEFSRIENFIKGIMASEQYQKAKKLSDYISANKGTLPKNFDYPDFINIEDTDWVQTIIGLSGSLEPLFVLVLAFLDHKEIVINSHEDLLTVLTSISQIQSPIKQLSERV